MSEKPIYEEPEIKEKKGWSFWGWGLLFFTVWTIALMFILEAGLHPRDSFTATIIAYVLGMLGLVAFTVLVRKAGRVLLSIPILLIIIFGAGYLFQHVAHAPIYNPFAPVSEHAITLVDNIDLLNDTLSDNTNITISENITILKKDYSIYSLSKLLFVVDLLIALPIFIFGTLGTAFIVQIFSEKARFATIFKAFFGVAFFILFLIIFPIVHLLVAGVVDLGGNASMGVMYTMQGFSAIGNFTTATQGDINEAIANFTLAADWFQKAGSDIKTFLGALGLAPWIGTAAEDLAFFVTAAFILFDGIGPTLNGTYQIFQGFSQISEAFGGGGLGLSAQGDGIKKDIIDEGLFNEGMEVINDGLLYLGDAMPYLRNATAEIQKADMDNIKIAIALTIEKISFDIIDIENLTEVFDTLDMVGTYFDMFCNATDVIEILLNKPTVGAEESDYTVLSHFLYGAYNLIKAADIIGNSTSFEGTDVYFNSAGTNFTLISEEFDSPVVTDLMDSDVPYLNDTLRFIVRMTDIAGDLSFFGANVSHVFSNFENFLDNFDVGYENVTDYNPILSDIDDLILDLGPLNYTAYEIDADLNLVQYEANQSLYGDFSQPAYEFSSTFQQFNLTQNIENTYTIALSFKYLFGAMSDLKDVVTAVTAGNSSFESADYGTALTQFSAANDSLASAIPKMWNASYYFNQTDLGGMTQLETSRESIAVIYFALLDIQSDMSRITEIAGEADGGNLSNIGEVPGLVASIMITLADINTDLQNITTIGT